MIVDVVVYTWAAIAPLAIAAAIPPATAAGLAAERRLAPQLRRTAAKPVATPSLARYQPAKQQRAKK